MAPIIFATLGFSRQTNREKYTDGSFIDSKGGDITSSGNDSDVQYERHEETTSLHLGIDIAGLLVGARFSQQGLLHRARNLYLPKAEAIEDVGQSVDLLTAFITQTGGSGTIGSVDSLAINARSEYHEVEYGLVLPIRTTRPIIRLSAYHRPKTVGRLRVDGIFAIDGNGDEVSVKGFKFVQPAFTVFGMSYQTHPWRIMVDIGSFQDTKETLEGLTQLGRNKNNGSNLDYYAAMLGYSFKLFNINLGRSRRDMAGLVEEISSLDFRLKISNGIGLWLGSRALQPWMTTEIFSVMQLRPTSH